MKSFLPLIAVLLFACNENKNPVEADKIIDELELQRKVDSAMTSMFWDTIGLDSSPIKVKSFSLKEAILQDFEINVTYQNTSDKPIDAIRFRWYLQNAFREPADIGSDYGAGFGGGYSDEPIQPGEERTGTWSVDCKDAKRIVKAWPREIVYQDGAKWETRWRP
jgi:hypothetical protein